LSAAADDRGSQVFAALADPTRRALLARVATEGPLSATQLAATLPISRQAVAKHLGILGEAGLVAPTREGRSKAYRVVPEPLAEARAWLDDVGATWDRRLSALEEHLARGAPRGGR
jgi:DNA-binding transcriptional ArsR family regulator